MAREIVTAPRRSLKLALALVAVLGLGLIITAYARADNVTNMVSHGGRIMPTSTTYAIFWLPAGVHFEPPAWRRRPTPATTPATKT